MKIELKIQDKEMLEAYAERLIKFSKPICDTGKEVIYNIKDRNIPGLLWIICDETKKETKNEWI